MVSRREGVGGIGEKGQGIEKYKLVLKKESWGCKYSMGNRVAKEHKHRTHGHGQWCGDCPTEWEGWVERAKGGTFGTTVIV